MKADIQGIHVEMNGLGYVGLKIFGGNIMVTVGDVLTSPESGWKRYDDTEKNIIYEGSWTSATAISDADYKNSIHYALGSGVVKFNFIGTKIRIFDGLNLNRSEQIKITIDGISEVFSENAAHLLQAIAYEKLGLPFGEHVVVIENMSSGYVGVDAIDIDVNGELKPFSPIDNSKVLLRITMSDSSEREYEVNTTGVNSFIQWYNRVIGAGNSYYSFDKELGSKKSKEYLAFEKIISFKTKVENDQVLLKIIMSDSSEREYKLTSADDFVKWFNRTVAECSTGTNYYFFTDSGDASIEYLAFDKIISFEVILLD